MKMHIVKREGHKEIFDERKVYASCFAACLNAHIDKYKSEEICEKVTKEIKDFIGEKKEITSDQIFKQAIKSIRKFDKNAAFMYETHRDIS